MPASRLSSRLFPVQTNQSQQDCWLAGWKAHPAGRSCGDGQRASGKLLYWDFFSPRRFPARHGVNLRVENGTKALEHLDTGCTEVPYDGAAFHGTCHQRGQPGASAHAITLRVRRGAPISRACCSSVRFGHFGLSIKSTVSVPSSSLAFRGSSDAMVVGRPTCRRIAPTSITSSSPFLNTLTSPGAVNAR